MKKNNMFKNIKWFYGISVIVAVYFTYLFSRMWILGKKGIVIIGIFFIGLFLYLTRKYIKANSDYKVKDKKSIVLVIMGAFIISASLLFVGREFFIYDYEPIEIKIKAIEEDTKLDISIIDGVVINNLLYSRYDDYFNNEYDERKEMQNGYISVMENDGELLIKIKHSYSAKILLNYDRENIIIKDNNIEQNIKADQQQYKYSVQSDSVKDSFSIIRGICSFSSIFYIIILIVVYFMNKKNHKDKYIFILCLALGIITLFYINDSMISISPDSYSYINFDFKSLLALKPSGRTPIYPMIVNLIKVMFSNSFLEFTVIFQYIVWFISIIYLYKIIGMLTSNQRLSLIGAILYALAPMSVIWNGSILTESLALSGTLIFIYYMIKYIKTDKSLYGNISIILSFILTFLRPTAIIYLLGAFIFIVLKLIFEKCKKCDIKCLITEIICLIFVVIYAICFHKTFGIYSISDAVVRQDLMVTIREGFYKNSNDEEFIKNIEIALENNPNSEWEAMSEVLLKYPLAKTKKLTNYCRNHSMKEYIEYIKNLVKSHAAVNFEGYAYINMNNNTLWIHNALYHSFDVFTFMHVYILITIEILVLIKKWIVSKKVPWIYCGLFFFPLVIVVSSFIGTCAEFMRTAVCCVPFAYLILIMLIYDALIKKEKAK